ncbi:hypothetical protein RFI_32528 [Reticulomyxa filosa]|uniref:Dynein heavy chain n=1 Tax=Reticulomyxa filosa TaxID=46433 RepID=X6LSL6_RETFI|nr:hypothetical protein RFI_32528 [Reticulomyxa filosa]|eukprot:ETO04868.1 hypothetical protein RFI_32528 [Reticulomyxa filosa]
MSAVMTLLGEDSSWMSSKKALSDANFLLRLKEYDKDSIDAGILKKIKRFTTMEDFVYESVKSKSIAAAAMCSWVCAMEVYAEVYAEVEPKREKLKQAQADLFAKQESLKEIMKELEKIEAHVLLLKAQFDKSEAEKKELTEKADELETKLGRAGQLLEGLYGERVRWEATIDQLKELSQNLVGDCAIAAAFLTYAGPFDAEYRNALINQHWTKFIKFHQLKMSNSFQFHKFLVDPTNLRKWEICGLPSDSFSADNAALVMKAGIRVPLIIDPQEQAKKWIQHIFQDQLEVIDTKADLVSTLTRAIQFGTAVLVKGAGEVLDSTFDPLLSKNFVVQGSKRLVKFGTKLIDYHENFRLFITTCLSNPHYCPDTCTKVSIVKFGIKLKGLEDQLLGIVVQHEEPKLEQDKFKLAIEVSQNKKQLIDLEDEILNTLTNAKGSLLGNTLLIDTLQHSKTASENVKEALAVSEETERSIDCARENYRSCAIRAAILYSVLMDLAQISPMYQFSLESDQLRIRVAQWLNSSRNYKYKLKKMHPFIEDEEDLEERIEALNNWHIHSVYENTCRGLFEKHKLLFSFRMCVTQLQLKNKINMSEYQFFLKGAQISNRDELPPSINDEWLDNVLWENVCQLSKFPAFADLMESFNQNGRAWKVWFQEESPEAARLPGDWDNKLDEFQKMVCYHY